MRFARSASIVGLMTALLMGSFGPASAADFTNEFLKEARNRGYGRVMVEYLTALNESNKLPSELKETYDLEMSKALRVAAANDAFNKEEREKWQVESKERLEKFVKEHANHPEVASAQSSFGDLAMERGLAQIRQSRGTQDKDQKAKHLAEARKAFEEARPRFADAATRYEARFDQMQAAIEALKAVKGTPLAKVRKAEAMTEDTLFDWLENRFKVGLTEFYFAQTYEDVKDKARVESLAKAAKQFDDIYQDNRESYVGMTAHAWHGKAVDEAGDYELAGEIYEEVLANVDPNPNVETGLEAIFAQVFYFKALLEIKKGAVEGFIKMAPDWLLTYKNYKHWRKTDGYQGINLEYAKQLAAKKDKASLDDQRKIMSVVSTALKEIAKQPGEHQDDAILLQNQLGLGKPGGGDAEAGSVAEALALGDEAGRAAHWEEAEKNYVIAQKLAKDSKKPADKKEIPTIDAKLEQVRYRQAAVLFTDGKFDEVVKICGKIAKNETSETGPMAAALAVQASLMIYARSPDPDAKAKALDRLTQVAEYTIKTWPDKAEADDARIAMGQAKLVQGKFEEAIDVFEKVNQRSERLGNGLFLAGQTHWRLYTQAGEKNDPAKGPARAAKAESNLTQAVEFFRKKREEKPKEPPPTQLPEAELLLGEVYVDSGNGVKAVDLLAPKVAAILADKEQQKNVDNVMLRTFLAGVRAYMAAGDLKKAADSSLAFMEFAPDQPQINKILTMFMSLMQLEWQKASAAAIEARGGNDLSAKDAAETQLKTSAELLGKMIGKLKDRQLIDLKAQLFMAQAAMDIGQPELAEPLYNALLPKLEQAPANDPQKKAIPNIRSALIGIVRAKGDHKTALEQVDKLLVAMPNVLSFMMERGRILQAWAEKDEAQLDAAVNQWVEVRTTLQGEAKKRPEYYEANYNAAYCLFMDSQKKKDPKKAQDAAKLLNALLFMNPKLNGPKMVAEYNDLLKKVDPEGYKKRVEAEKKKAKDEKEKEKAKTAAK